MKPKITKPEQIRINGKQPTELAPKIKVIGHKELGKKLGLSQVNMNTIVRQVKRKKGIT